MDGMDGINGMLRLIGGLIGCLYPWVVKITTQYLARFLKAVARSQAYIQKGKKKQFLSNVSC
jgi:hypothetical protein